MCALSQENSKLWFSRKYMRKAFFKLLLEAMRKDEDIIVLTGDLGFGLLDEIRDELPEQFYNCGASEQAMLGIAVGLTLEGKRVFAYSITPFILYRAFETIRNYLNHEKIPVILIGSGRDNDYEHEGFSHYAGDDKLLFGGKNKMFMNIQGCWPERNEDLPNILKTILIHKKPYYVNLKK